MVAVKNRRARVRALLVENAVSSQQELLALLAADGLESTQPVLSRDLRALGTVAGDDTIFVAVDSSRRGKAVTQRVKNLI